MANRSFEIFTKVNNYKVDRNVAYGENNGYIITLYQKRFVKTFLIPLPNITNAQKTQVIDFLIKQKAKFSLKQVYFDNTVLVIKIKESFRNFNVDILNNLIDTTINYLQENKIAVGKHCIFCGKDNADAKKKIMNIEYYIHRSCYDNALAEINKEYEEMRVKKDEKTKNKEPYALPVASLGLIVISFLWFLISHYGWYTSLIMLSCGNFTLGLYYIFKQKMINFHKILIIFEALLSYIIFSTLILIKNDIALSNIFNPEYRNITLNLLIAFISIVISFFLTFSRYNKLERLRE